MKKVWQKLHSLHVNIPLVQLLSYKKAVQLTESEIEKYSTYCIGLGMNYKYIDAAYVKKNKETRIRSSSIYCR